MAVDFEGRPIADDRLAVLERFIRAELYRARRDVFAIVHSHSPSIIPFGAVLNVALQPVYHMSAFLGSGAAHFEIRPTAGNASDMLVRNSTIGRALAESLGGATTVFDARSRLNGRGIDAQAGGISRHLPRAECTHPERCDAARSGDVSQCRRSG